MGYKNFTSRLFYYLKPHVGKLVFTSLMMDVGQNTLWVTLAIWQTYWRANP
jgi:hypothetical protein